jgi:hypothetical protein
MKAIPDLKIQLKVHEFQKVQKVEEVRDFSEIPTTLFSDFTDLRLSPFSLIPQLTFPTL